jgi:hypothetical protein
MKSPTLASAPIEAAESEDIFFMTNLSPRMTGLPMSMWVSPRGDTRHDALIKVNMSHGRQMKIENTAVVPVRPTPRVVAGRLSTEDQRLVAQWVGFNLKPIISYWDNQLDTDQFMDSLKRLPQP